MSDEVTPMADVPPTTDLSALAQKAQQVAERKAAQAKARAYLKSVTAGQHPDITSATPDSVLEALHVLFPVKPEKSNASRTTVIDRICALFPEVGAEVSLMDVFREFKMGVSEMRVRIRECIYNRPADSRYWITYNPTTEVYRLEGIGANPPEGWTGVLPKEMR